MGNEWKCVLVLSARLIEAYDNIVVLECLIDSESKTYQEREFHAALFEGYKIEQGSLFQLKFYERSHESRMEVLDGTGIIDEAIDFPKLDFSKLFSNSRFFKK